MPQKKHRIEIPLTPDQKAYLDNLGGNSAKRFRDAMRKQFSDFPPDAPFRVRKDYLANNPALKLVITPEFIQAIQPYLALYNDGDVYQLDFITDKWADMGYHPSDVTSDEMLEALIRVGAIEDK